MNKLDQLVKNGFRITKPRQAILDVLVSHPVTVQEIYESLEKKGIHIDLTSVYRSLELFVELKLVQVIELGEGKKRYELLNTDNHHHHVICNTCGVIEDVSIEQEKEILKHVTTKSHFKIDTHTLEFFGQCQNCQ